MARYKCWAFNKLLELSLHFDLFSSILQNFPLTDDCDN